MPAHPMLDDILRSCNSSNAPPQLSSSFSSFSRALNNSLVPNYYAGQSSSLVRNEGYFGQSSSLLGDQGMDNVVGFFC